MRSPQLSMRNGPKAILRLYKRRTHKGTDEPECDHRRGRGCVALSADRRRPVHAVPCISVVLRETGWWRGSGSYGRAFSVLKRLFRLRDDPKAVVFFMALFPGFISPDLNIAFQSRVYGAIFILPGHAMLALYVVRSRLALQISIDKIGGLGLFWVGAVLVFKGCKELPTG